MLSYLLSLSSSRFELHIRRRDPSIEVDHFALDSLCASPRYAYFVQVLQE